MAISPKSLANLRPIKPGETRNPGGKPLGARNRLTAAFLNRLADDFEEHGKEAIERCRTEDPSAYIRAVAALMPKEIEVRKVLEDMPDEQLERIAGALQAAILGNGTETGAEAHPTNTGPETVQ